MLARDATADDIVAALQRLLPRGRIWPRDRGAVLTQVLYALAPTFQRVIQRANYLLIDAHPDTTEELLPDWEASLGLPDECQGLSPTLQARKEQVLARFTASGGQSVSYFVGFAAALGYAVTVGEFAPFRADINHAGDPLYGPEAAFEWQVNAPTFTVNYFEADVSAGDEPLATWDNTVLQCELGRVKPAQSILNFNYS